MIAHTTIDVNSTNIYFTTPIRVAVANNELDAAKLLVEKGGNLFKKRNDGRSAMDHDLGRQVLQHANDLVWASVKDVLHLSKSCSTNALPFDLSIAIPSSLINALGNADLVREWIAPFLLRPDIITIDPEAVDEEQEADEVRRKAEEDFAAAISSSSSKRARDE